jgi:hypothetical protein
MKLFGHNTVMACGFEDCHLCFILLHVDGFAQQLDPPVLHHFQLV